MKPIKEEVTTNIPEGIIPKFEDIMIDPSMRLFGDKEEYEINGSSEISFRNMREMAVTAATNPDYAIDLDRNQLYDIGFNFLRVYENNLRFYINEVIYNNIVLVINNISNLVNTGFIEYSNIRENIYNTIFKYTSDIPFDIGELHYKLFRGADNSRFIIEPELRKGSKYFRPLTKESVLNELNIYGDLFTRTLYSAIMYTVEYTCDAYFYNFGMKYSPDVLSSVVDALMKGYNSDKKSPFEVIDKYVFCNQFVKGQLAYEIGKLFVNNINTFLFDVFTHEERAIPSDIFRSLGDIDSIQERIEKEKNIKDGKIIDVKPHIVDARFEPDFVEAEF